MIAACTATEVFVNTLMRFISKAVGGDPNELASKLKAPFRNQLEHHLPELLKVPMDTKDSNSVAGRWWTDCYLLRNKVVPFDRSGTRSFPPGLATLSTPLR